ncbi:MAG: LysM peptidoglycan-binding domain-containing protein [Anaerolineales bacterium]|nr:LysM peptidoglycan-binding domain-containing protein [Anaerolineales bacterium]
MSVYKVRSSRVLVGVVCAALVLALFATAAPTSTALAVTCKFKHTVQAGETVISIADLYGVDWLDIVEANDLTAPYVLAIGQKLCIPGGTKPSDIPTGSADDSDDPLLGAIPGLGHILISVENFAPKATYYVKIIPRGVGIPYKIGHFRTNKEGDFTDWMNVPSYVPRSNEMTVCVKNAVTDAVSCVVITDIYPGLNYFSGSSCTRNVR